MEKKVLITFFKELVNEGGHSRNKAFSEYFGRNGYKIINLKISNNLFTRLLTLIKFVFLLVSLKNSHIMIHGNLISSFVMLNKFSSRKYGFMIKKFLTVCANKNKVFIEINDLKYEQAIDLEILTYSKKTLDIENDILYKTKGLHYIFASNSMSLYATEKYALDINKVYVAINGGNKLNILSEIKKNTLRSQQLKFVYAGTLNRGRQIEEMIEIFREIKGSELHLLGTSGEWLMSYNVPENVKYVGQLNEKEAHIYLSKCDIGLIPYESERFYYNLCYPTKASFYLTSGIPFLSTNLIELKNVINYRQIAIFADLSDWKRTIEKLDYYSISELKRNVESEKKEFEWQSVLEKLESEIIKGA
ncbi:glycosyltransferase family protein [Solibacillus ferritrahens]|uniref:hypothetical protein n=1 Tax=Solibacillus ferritrahens TaxID=3098620 RepID=UPI00300B1F53